MIKQLSLALLMLLATACQIQSETTPDPEEIVQATAERMNQIEGFHFVIEQSGAAAYLDPDGTFALSRAEGDYVAPNRAQATAGIVTPVSAVEVDIISIGDESWQTNFLTRVWETAPAELRFNPARLFDSEGLPAILANDLNDLTSSGRETLAGGPDAQLFHLSGTVNGGRLNQMSAGLISADSADIELWIAPDTFELVQVILTEPPTGEREVAIWQVTLSEFGQTVTIEPPLPAEG